jgi:hypothetical protein
MSDNFEGVTFAFSHKDRVWKTRYSFTPTSYAYVDNFMLSTNGRHPTSTNNVSDTSNHFWLHDTNGTHNRFYGFQYDMSVAFVANYSPSAVKIFKSLSVESNSGQWSGFVTTNTNPAGSSQSEYQTTPIEGFIRKEGASYTEIRSSQQNSTANISAGFNAFGGIGYNIDPNSTSADVGLSAINPLFEWDADIDIQHGQITAGRNCFVVVSGPEGLSYIQGNQLVPVASTVPGFDSGFAVVKSLNADSQTVTLEMNVPVQDIGSYPFDWAYLDPQSPDNNNYPTNTAVYISAPAVTNGDFMRGHYMNVYLTNISTTPVECLAFNVNYEPTKLDHSLGQNA